MRSWIRDTQLFLKPRFTVTFSVNAIGEYKKGKSHRVLRAGEISERGKMDFA